MLYDLGKDERLSDPYARIAADISEELVKRKALSNPQDIMSAEDVRAVLRKITERILYLLPGHKVFQEILAFINERPPQRKNNIFIATLGLAPLYLIYFVQDETGLSVDQKKELKNLLRQLLQMRILDRVLNPNERWGFQFARLLDSYSSRDSWKLENKFDCKFESPREILEILKMNCEEEVVKKTKPVTNLNNKLLPAFKPAVVPASAQITVATGTTTVEAARSDDVPASAQITVTTITAAAAARPPAVFTFESMKRKTIQKPGSTNVNPAELEHFAAGDVVDSPVPIPPNVASANTKQPYVIKGYAPGPDIEMVMLKHN